MQYKLRISSVSSAESKKQEKNYCISIPKDIAMIFGQGTFFFVERSGTAIVFSSGASIFPTEKQINKYEFQDVRIK